MGIKHCNSIHEWVVQCLVACRTNEVRATEIWQCTAFSSAPFTRVIDNKIMANTFSSLFFNVCPCLKKCACHALSSSGMKEFKLFLVYLCRSLIFSIFGETTEKVPKFNSFLEDGNGCLDLTSFSV